MNRRDFLLFAGTLAAAASLARIHAAQGSPTLRVGVIGCGWFGGVDLRSFLQTTPVEVVALCDPDTRALERLKATLEKQLPGSKLNVYGDFREMLAGDKLDIVIVATPDHWHALAAIAAMKAGAHVFLEKPISVDVIEGEAVVAAARKYQRTVQVNTQRRSTKHIVEAKDKFITSGRLGRIAHVETYCYFPMWNKDDAADEEPPPELDWEMWTGPAPLRRYNRLAHPGGWRRFEEYSNGIMGDMGVHMVDMARFLLDLKWPRSVHSIGGIQIFPDATGNVPDTQVATFDFERVKMTWEHRMWGEAPDPDYPWGATFYGDQGTLRVSPMRYDFTPLAGGDKEGQAAEEEPAIDKATEGSMDAAMGPPNRRHVRDFVAALGKGTRPVADVEEGHISSACCVLANISLKLGRSIAYDPITRTVPGDAEATRMLARPYRQPWIHPTPDSV